MRFESQDHAYRWYHDFFEQTVRIVRGDCYRWHIDKLTGRDVYLQEYAGRQWFRRESYTYQLPPAVSDMMLHKCYKPAAWSELLLEWPHRSLSDPNRLAYTRDDRAGDADRQTITSIGKYLTRHFPDAPADVIRDLVAQYTYSGTIQIETTSSAMLDAVLRGPSSCMSYSGIYHQCVDGKERHPYAVYDPSLGWRMAVRYGEEGEVLGRCLVWHDANADESIFVRSYKRELGERAHTGRDEAIEAYLMAKGYKRESCWPDGTPLMYYELRKGGWLMPYIDGGTQRVDVCQSREETTIDSNGDFEADSTSGGINAATAICECCGERYNDEEEGGWVGRHEDTHVCQHCLDNVYTYVAGYRGNEYYVPNDDVVYVGSDTFDINYLSENNVIALACGDYCYIDNAVYIESRDEWYEVDDDDVCYAEDTGEYELKDDCWMCEQSNTWYTDAVDYVEIDGCLYHPDNAPETETTDDASSTAA